MCKGENKMVESFVLGTLGIYNISLIVLKKIYVNIEGQTRRDILEKGLYHITKKENAEKIMKDGHINPSGPIASMGVRRTFFFAGIPTIELLRENVAGSAEQFEWTAINVKLDEKDIDNYKIRKYDDNSVTCKGKCELEEGKVRMVELCMDMNQDGIPFIREKTPEEVEHGYEPSEELKKKFNFGNKQLVVKRNLLRAYFVKPFQMISKLISALKFKRESNAIEDNLEEVEERIESQKDSRKEFLENLKVEVQRTPETTEKKKSKNIAQVIPQDLDDDREM